MIKIIGHSVVVLMVCILSTEAGNCPNLDTTTTSFTKSLDLNPDVKASINNKIKAFTPNITCSIASASVSVSGEMNDCCNSADEIISDGDKSVEGTLTATATVGGNLWGTTYNDTKTKTVLGSTYTYTVGVDLGLPLSVTLTPSCTVGFIKKECVSKEWWYGNFDVAAAPTIAITASGNFALERNGNEVVNKDFEVTPISVTATMHGIVGYNTADSDSGAYGDADINSITATISFKIPLVLDWSHPFNIWPPAE